MSRVVTPRSASALLVVLAGLLAACSGGGDTESVPTPVVNQPAAAPSGALVVTIRDPLGKLLPGATVLASANPVVSRTATTGPDGRATLSNLPRLVQLSATHPLGTFFIASQAVTQGGVTALDVTIKVRDMTTAVVLPAAIPPGGISVDRTELELQVTLASDAFEPAGYGTFAGSLPTPSIRLDDCTVWLDTVRTSATCERYGYTPNRVTGVTSYHYDPVGVPALPSAGPPYGAMLLIEQSGRLPMFDPLGLRSFAARQFIRRARSTPSPDWVAIAGFAGAGNSASSPPLIPQLPLWLPPGTATAFSADLPGQESAIDALEPLVGGSAPVFTALSAAMNRTSTEIQPPRPRAVVALLGGSDDTGLSGSQRQAALNSLRLQQTATGTQFILIAGPLDETSPERDELADLAAALRAPILFAGYPANYKDRTDALHTAFALAADILAGMPLQSLQVTFRMKSTEPGGFASGSVLRGVVYIESSTCPMGCWELPLHFAVTVP